MEEERAYYTGCDLTMRKVKTETCGRTNTFYQLILILPRSTCLGLALPTVNQGLHINYQQRKMLLQHNHRPI